MRRARRAWNCLGGNNIPALGCVGSLSPSKNNESAEALVERGEELEKEEKYVGQSVSAFLGDVLHTNDTIY